jgi:hypothetical protein
LESNIVCLALIPDISSSLIGGGLSQPSDRFPHFFGGEFWRQHPYFLPCLAVAIITTLSIFIVLFSFEEVGAFFCRPISRFSHRLDPTKPFQTFPGSSEFTRLPVQQGWSSLNLETLYISHHHHHCQPRDVRCLVCLSRGSRTPVSRHAC